MQKTLLKKCLQILPCVLFLCSGLIAQDNEYYFRFTITQSTELDVLTHVISIDNVVGDTVYAYANDKQWEQMQTLGYRIERLPHPSSLHDHAMDDGRHGLLQWDHYPTYAGYRTMMCAYADSFPAICRLDTFGYSVLGRQLLVLKISDSVDLEQDEPEFLYTSSMHGDETVGYVLTLRLADYLLHQYGQLTPEGQRVTRLVDNMEIWINPLSNPDGTYRLGGDTTVNNATRTNAHGVDLNRDFPDRINDTSNTVAGREPETQEMMRFVFDHNFTLSANFHGGAQVVNYPWDNGAPSGTYSICPDDAWFIALSLAYALPNPDMLSGGFPNGITNGCDWYAIFGGRQDWIYWWQGGRETTIELWNVKNPPGSVLLQRWTNNLESFLAYMERALKGIRGVVTDAQTGEPVKARITIQNIPGVPVFTDSAVGDFHRLLNPGTYTLIASAGGYVPDTVFNVLVTDSAATRVDIALQRVPAPITLNFNVTDGWNLVSVPVSVGDYSRPVLFPSSISEAFSYQSGYIPQPVLANGIGYWLKFPSNQSIGMTGFERLLDTLTVQTGWNLIGSISQSLAVTDIHSIPPGLVTSNFFGYDSGGYTVADSILPGRACWVKVSQSGVFVLSASGRDAVAAGRIRVEPAGDLVPPRRATEASGR